MPHSNETAKSSGAPARGLGFLNAVEWLGNKLPDPIFLFVFLALLVMAISHVGVLAGWRVQPLRPVVITEAVLDASGQPATDAQTGSALTRPVLDPKTGRPQTRLDPKGEPITGRSLLSADGIYWALSSMVRNFMNFPPLGIVLTGMLGIGVAEKVGLFGALIKWLAGIMPARLLTPTVIFIGIMSNVASDAGYIVLPPLAAALYMAVGRSPLAGIAAAFAGISGGFSANLLIGTTDALAAGLSAQAAQTIDPKYEVVATCNWYFLAGSAVLLTFLGWFVSERMVEPRLRFKKPEDGGPAAASAASADSQRLTPQERRGLRWALIVEVLALAALAAVILIPGAPLYGQDQERPLPRWSQAIVPLIFLLSLAPGVAYGIVVGEIRSTTHVAKAFIHAMSTMAPIVALAFFAAQFIEYLKYSRLDAMIAYTGGQALVELGLPPTLLLGGIVLLSLTINLFIGSMSAKWSMLAPILVPMLMMVGLSPELTQVAYRVGDSVTNIITPMNSYIIVILAFVQRHAKSAGMGTLFAMMLPYSLVFMVVWTLFLMGWFALGVPLGPQGPLHYVPVH